MILDLSVFEEETLDIVMANNVTIHIPKPSEREIIRIKRAKNISADTDPAEAEATMNDLTYCILRSNLDGRIFDRETIEKMPQQIKLQILNAYAEFARRLLENPT